MDQPPVDFFISYTSADASWAAWIAWILEEAKYNTKIQAWDFLAGANFVLEMHEALKEAARTIAVLSPDYMNSHFAAPEWRLWPAIPKDGNALWCRFASGSVRPKDCSKALSTSISSAKTKTRQSKRY